MNKSGISRNGTLPYWSKEEIRSMNKKAKTSIAVIASVVLIAVIAILVVVNLKFGDTPDPLAEEITTTSPATTEAPATEETPSQVSTEAQTEEQTHSAADNYGNPNVQTITIDEDQWYLTLVNRNRKLPEDFIPPKTSYLVDDSDAELDSRCADQYIAMYNAALKENIVLYPLSGYRRISTQKKNYENKINLYLNQGYSYLDAAQKAATIILPPGTSEHNLGLAMDICSLEESFANTKEFAWLMEHAQDYGFILRYPADKQDITQITYEPWHWRYVGVDAAKAMKASGQCLEEYLGYA